MQPSEALIQAVMKRTGWDYIQARNHLIARRMAVTLGKVPEFFPATKKEAKQ
jgi:hypothetical protein